MTGVQTCALPILDSSVALREAELQQHQKDLDLQSDALRSRIQRADSLEKQLVEEKLELENSKRAFERSRHEWDAQVSSDAARVDEKSRKLSDDLKRKQLELETRLRAVVDKERSLDELRRQTLETEARIKSDAEAIRTERETLKALSDRVSQTENGLRANQQQIVTEEIGRAHV